MKSFLEEVAEDLYTRYGDALSACRILFPSRRARIFFIDALGGIIDRPLWQPHYTTIDELMSELSGLRAGDKLRLVTELYKVYSELHNEPFDKFYFWGEMLISDFDMIDKYRIEAEQLFTNISDLKELEADLSYLTERQQEIITRFWSSVGPEESLSEQKKRFLYIWRTLPEVYTRYRRRLQQLGIAYGGMMQRRAIERLECGEVTLPPDSHFVVAGFNALSTCERALFRYLQAQTKTDFYWDADRYYIDHKEQEAGMFLRRNLVDFPPAKRLSEEGMSRPKRMQSVAAVSNAVQCKQVAEILTEWAKAGKLDKETAVVLTDENLLMPLLYALPKELGKVNVTMGYPLRQTLAYTFVERLIELQAHGRKEPTGWSFYHVDVTGLLSHPFLTAADARLCAEMQREMVEKRHVRLMSEALHRHPLLEVLFRPTTTWQEMSDWMLEVLEAVARVPYEGEDSERRIAFLSMTATEIQKLRNSIEACEIAIETTVYCSLLRRHLQTLRIPFRGEPLQGIQVMGILETRNLDFKRVVILSMTDNNFPGNHLQQGSFIPYSLRAAFDLPTPEHHEGVYAYYFYRLIQRAEEVTMLYCSRADEKSTGEPSRYLRQLDYESPHTLHRVEVGVDVNLVPPEPIVVEKAPLFGALLRFVDADSKAALSPTALYRYVACPLRFYFHSVAALRVEDAVAEEVDAPMFGTILHAAAQELYQRIEGVQHPGEMLRAMMQTGEVERAVDRSIGRNYLNREEVSKEEYPGNLLLVRDIVIRYLKRGVMAYDAAHDKFAVVGREERVDYAFPFTSAGASFELKLSGIADRIDSLDNGLLRVVDYKTGTPHLEFNGVDALFHGEARERQSNTLQTLLYAMMLSHTRGCDVLPTLYYVRTMHREEYSPLLVDKEKQQSGLTYRHYAEEFETLLGELLDELFNPAIPFYQTDDEKSCQYCDFKLLCKR